MIDPHTADGLKVAREFVEDATPMLVLETALPVKFAATIREATGVEAPRPAGLEGLEDRPRRCTVMPADLARVKRFIADNAV